MEPRWGATAPWAHQIASASGIVFVVLAVLAFFIAPGPDTGATSDEVVTYFTDDASAVRWGAFLFGLAGSFLLWFGGTAAAALRRAENDPSGRLPAIAVAGVASSVALYLVGVGSWAALARTADEQETSRGLYDLGELAFGMSSFTAAVFVWALATGIMRTRLLADWVGWLGAVLTVLLVVNGAYQMFRESSGIDTLGTITFLAFLLWVLVVSAFLMLGLRATAERPVAAAP
jgi:hypothetical protein